VMGAEYEPQDIVWWLGGHEAEPAGKSALAQEAAPTAEAAPAADPSAADG
jgi:hypothetical protein